MAIGKDFESHVHPGHRLLDLSVGTGITLVGIWLIMAALTCFLFLQIWPNVIAGFSAPGAETVNDFNASFILGILALVNATPSILACKITKYVLGRTE